MTHDYTRKGGIVHAEIMLPAHAPPEFADRSTLWNSVEQIEKARDSQLAREIEAALPRELSREQQLALVRAYVKDNFVDKGMCADFAIHDKGTGNPHVHIMLTVRPLKENGAWGAKCRKAYDLDENGQRIPDGKGGWKNHREDTTDWNDKGNVEIWRAAWAACTNRALEAAGHPALVDHRSYKRQGIDKIPSVHLGPAAITERGEMWEQYNQYKSIHKQLAKVKPEKREQFEQRHSRELILYDAAARYLKELKDSDEAITPKAWQLEINQLAAGKQTDTLAMKAMREDLKAVERLRKTAEQLSRQERDKSHDREPER